jgi:hypothetical protein
MLDEVDRSLFAELPTKSVLWTVAQIALERPLRSLHAQAASAYLRFSSSQSPSPIRTRLATESLLAERDGCVNCRPMGAGKLPGGGNQCDCSMITDEWLSLA